MIQNMAKRFGVPIGISDHTLGSLIPTLSVALGAKLIEKHLVLDKSISGPDTSFSLSESEFTKMVHNVRNSERAMGRIGSSLTKTKRKNRVFCRSLYISKDLKKGEQFTENNVRSVRPGYGLHPKHYDLVIGSIATADLLFGTPLRLEHFRSK